MVIPIKLANEKPMGVVTLLRKSTENKFNNMDLSLGDTLSRRLAVALDNSRLYYKAQEANRAKSAFLANVSHEIRTPLGAMLGFADIIKEDGRLSEENQEAIETVIRNGQQLLRIVDEILDISKVESERIQIEHIAFDLKNLLGEVVHLLQGRAEEKGIQLHMHYKEIPDRIVSDPTRIRQILINVIGNAIKFTDKGFVSIEVKKRKFSKKDKQGRLEFIVTDTGIGISPDQKSNLFQPFAQADSSTTRRFGGTGLGLFLSRKLARLLGGDVILDSSKAGKGSSFSVTIAYSLADAAIIRETIVESRPPESKIRTSHILIVDDAADNRELFRHYLKRLGFADRQIETAENGAEAIDMACKKTYGLILMDIQMPKMDGFQALDELKRRKYPGPIVALTAHAMKGDAEKCLAAGFDAYLQKPLSREALKKLLESINNAPPGPRPRENEPSP
jgi:signal transduction histidine kinase/ActR/RegA family two-component response regulator